MTMLGMIVAHTREILSRRKKIRPMEQVLAGSPTPGARRPFRDVLVREGRLNVIAEYKRRSPSRGVLRSDLAVVEVAQAYEVAGAAALSVLTEEEFFGGSLEDLQEARSATLLPVLRKDFIVDPYQIHEAAMAGADAILLIAAILSDSEIAAFRKTAADAGLETLVEVHDREELDRALAGGAAIVGVNNRDLKSMEVNLATSFELVPHIPDHCVAVSESGLQRREDLKKLRDAGFDAFLVGEHLMTSPDVRVALEMLLGKDE